MSVSMSIYPSDHDVYLFRQGNLHFSYHTFGAHPCIVDGISGVRFSVWAPHAKEVRVAGDFNAWNGFRHPLQPSWDSSGIWNGFIPGLKQWDRYKYEMVTWDGRHLLKADPYAFHAETRPGTGSIVYDLSGYEWGDSEWQRRKQESNPYSRPMNIYEVHLGTWKRKPDGLPYSYRELADQLPAYAAELGFTHIELLPVMEHPYDRSWGYQTTGFYAATSRFGTPKDLMYFVDRCHQHGLGVILDWVPGHFCKDDHGLRQFDGQPLYEYPDERMAEKLEWGTLSFDFGKPEVVNFLISNAIFWMDVYHMDGIRVDAVASILSHNFSKPPERHVMNVYGGHENLEAIDFVKRLNMAVFQYFPNALMMAEDSTDTPLVTAPVHQGGLGFNYKWNMGWMNDMLRYMKKDSHYRKWHHDLITFSFFYAFSENFVLPFSHDEVVHGKRSLISKMPGDYWQQFAQLRLLYGYLMTHPGKKLLFMGGEFGQFSEWKDLDQLDWHLLGYEMHGKMLRFVKELNAFYGNEPSLWELDHSPEGFEWIDPHNKDQSIIAFMRKSAHGEHLLVVCNFTPVPHEHYRLGVPEPGVYREVLNTDDPEYGGSGVINTAEAASEASPWHYRDHSVVFRLPPFAAVILKRSKWKEGIGDEEKRSRGDAARWGRGAQARGADQEFGEAGRVLRGEIPDH
nr:1,4-alpha-glucan branching protein GlgB [Paenibacillus turpanensis]